jgi:hypothetical protein
MSSIHREGRDRAVRAVAAVSLGLVGAGTDSSYAASREVRRRSKSSMTDLLDPLAERHT